MALEEIPEYRPVNLDIEDLAGKAFGYYGEKQKKMFLTLSASQKTRVLEDFRTHISYLQESLATRSGAIFFDYTCWSRAYNLQLHLPGDYLASEFTALNEVLSRELPPDYRSESDAIIRKSIREMEQCPNIIPSYIMAENPLAAIARSYLEALLTPDRDGARKIIDNAIDSGVAVRDIYQNVLQPVLRETGRLWQMGKVSVAKEHYVSASVQVLMARMHPHIIAAAGKNQKGKTLVAACVENEFHEIGIRMVTDFFEMDGWDTYYIGANTPAPSLLEAVRERNADVVAISSTMASDIPRVHYLIRSLRADPVTKKAKIIVGGYPFAIVPGLWKQVGADAWAGNAEDAVAAANRLTA
jgi:MerR family transcriptional regulator, light-induced transcriptional regulator